MGLLDVLGLAARAGNDRAADPAAAEGGKGGSLEDAVVIAHDLLAELLKKLPDGDKARDGFEAELASLRAKHVAIAADKRAAAEKAELASAAALSARVQKLVDKVEQARELEQTKGLVAVGLSAVNAMVLSVITDDVLRSSVNGELTKLKASQAKAGKIADPKAALAGWKALLAQVRTLQRKAEGARDASSARDELAPMFDAAKKAIAAVPGAARAKLEAGWSALDADRQRYVKAMDATALASIVKPRLARLGDLATALPGAAAKVDAALSRAAAALKKIEGDASKALQDKLEALQAERSGDWPAGKTIDEMAASYDRVAVGGEALAKEAEGLGPKLQRQKEIAALRKRLDGLKPRLDKAAGPAEAKVLEFLHKRVVDQLAQFGKYEAAADLKSCEVLFSSIGATLDSIDSLSPLYRAAKAQVVLARNGGIKAALAVKIEPATLAALRQTAIDSKQKDIEAMIDGGNLVAANRAIDIWLESAKTWTEAPAAYANLRSGQPKKNVMTELIGKPGGGAVFDALVADLPEKTTDTETMTTAIEARFGTKVKQFNHRNPGEHLADKDKAYSTPRSETNPDEPQKGLKELYGILRIVPQKDVTYTEKIVDYEEQDRGAHYQHRGADAKNDKSGKEDEIVMYAGRPGDANNTVDLGNVVARGEKVDPDCQPKDGAKTVNWYSYAALHEVAHGLDDARNVMGAHMAEAKWEEPSVDDVAKKVAAHFGYDEAYTLALMKGTPPATKPKRPDTVKSDDAWSNARIKVENWVGMSVVSANPWDSGALAKANAIGSRVYHEHSKGKWVGYDVAARARGIRGYQFRAPAEWFAELYAAYHMGRLKPSHPSAAWLGTLKTESETQSAH